MLSEAAAEGIRGARIEIVSLCARIRTLEVALRRIRLESGPNASTTNPLRFFWRIADAALKAEDRR